MKGFEYSAEQWDVTSALLILAGLLVKLVPKKAFG